MKEFLVGSIKIKISQLISYIASLTMGRDVGSNINPNTSWAIALK